MDRPSIQLYLADLSTNKRLRECSWGAKGVFMEVMTILHDSEHYGVVHYDLRKLSRVVRAPFRYIKELAETGVLKGADEGMTEPLIYQARHAGSLGIPVTLIPVQIGPLWYSARMVRDEYKRKINEENGRKSLSPSPPQGGSEGDAQGDAQGDSEGGGYGRGEGGAIGGTEGMADGVHLGTCAPAQSSSSSSSSSDLKTTAAATHDARPSLDDDWQVGFGDSNVIAMALPLTPHWNPGDTINAQVLLRAGQRLTPQEFDWLRQEFLSYRLAKNPHEVQTPAMWDHKFVDSVQRNLSRCRSALGGLHGHVEALRAKTALPMEPRRNGRKTRLDAAQEYNQQRTERRQRQQAEAASGAREGEVICDE